MKTYLHQCEKGVWHPRGNWSDERRCTREGKVQDPAGWHCTQHSDAKDRERVAKSDARYEQKRAERDALRAQTEAGALVPELLAALPGPQKLRDLARIINDMEDSFSGRYAVTELKKLADIIEVVKGKAEGRETP